MICEVSYELKLPSELDSVHPVFHVSIIKKCISDPESILPMRVMLSRTTSRMRKFWFYSLIGKSKS